MVACIKILYIALLSNMLLPVLADKTVARKEMSAPA